MLLDNCTTLVRERASRQGLVLALEVEDGLGDWVADIRKLKQVVINLLSNAVKFTPAGGRIKISCSTTGNTVSISVEDNGPGIPDDKLEAVFQPFVQLDRGLTRTTEGTGLGLAISRGLARGMGAEITLKTQVGKGSTFTLVLPLARIRATPSGGLRAVRSA
jgi:signal transduction histidine kinase